MKLFLYHRIKKYVFYFETVNAALLQRKFQIGYTKAVEMMDRLEADNIIKYAYDNWYVLGGLYQRLSLVDKDEYPEPPEWIPRFTEDNVLKILSDCDVISTSMLQKEFKVGYGAAAKMIDNLAEKGYITHDGRMWVIIK